MRPIYERWVKDSAALFQSRKTAWGSIRRALPCLSSSGPKCCATVRLQNCVAWVRYQRSATKPAVPRSGKGRDRALRKVYPRYMSDAKAALSNVFKRIMAAAQQWNAVHLLSNIGNRRRLHLTVRRLNSADLCARRGGAPCTTQAGTQNIGQYLWHDADPSGGPQVQIRDRI